MKLHIHPQTAKSPIAAIVMTAPASANTTLARNRRPTAASAAAVTICRWPLPLQACRRRLHPPAEALTMKTLLAALIAAVGVVWGWDLLNTAFPATAHPLWIARHEALNLSGFWRSR